MKARIALVVLLLLVCMAFLVSASTGAADRPSRAASASKAPLVGTWRRLTTCGELVAALKNAGVGKWVAEFVAGNGFVPGVADAGQIADPRHPCAHAVPRRHAHFFTTGGDFGSLDWKGQQVDDGKYKVIDKRTLVISKEFPSVTFHYSIAGRNIKFAPVVPRGCLTFRCAWALSMAYPGKAWQRVG
jgi:hypothetical protein